MLILHYLRIICKRYWGNRRNILDKDRTNVLLDKDMMISLKNMARLENKSVTMIVRDAITDYLSKNISKKEFGIIGIGESRFGDILPAKKKITKDKKAD